MCPRCVGALKGEVERRSGARGSVRPASQPLMATRRMFREAVTSSRAGA